MKSLNTNYLSRIDHLRFFAALLVLFYHFRGSLSLEGIKVISVVDLPKVVLMGWLNNGSTGVSLFLFLTGFLFCLISGLGEKKIHYPKFIYNRILRILPLVILLIFILISINRELSTPMDIFRVFALQLNTGHPYTGFGHDIFPLGVIWTIAVEFQFYLLFPFLALFLSRYGLRYLIVVVLLMIMIRYNMATVANEPMYWNFYHSIIGRLDQFVIGMIFAVLYSRGYFICLQHKTFACFIIFISIILLTWLFSFKTTDAIMLYLSFSIEAVLWGAVAIAYLSVTLPNLSKLDNILARLGEISFSVYILHLPIGAMMNKIFGFTVPVMVGEALLQATIKATIVVAVSFITYYVIEKPFMSFRVKYTSP